MSDELELKKIEKLTIDEYAAALSMIRAQMVDSDWQMLRVHYESRKQVITATELADKVGFENFRAANLRYGLLGAKLLEVFQIQLSEYCRINALVSLDNPNDEWEWTLRPQVVQALKKLRWFS